MAVSLSPFAGAGWQFFDNNGVILSGGKLYTYAAGTTSLATTYTSSSGSTANTNPIILNSSGRLANEIWLTVGLNYKFILKTSADVLIGTWDNIPAGTTDVADLQAALASSTGAGMIGYIQGGSGSVATTVQTKLRETVSILDFGGSVSNTNAQNKTALQLAITAVNANGGGNIVIPANLNYGYKVSDYTTWPDFTGTTMPIVVIDSSIGNSYGTYPTTYDGCQIRNFVNTPQTSPSPGLHDGNTEWLRANWAPNICISNDAILSGARTADDNRRASFTLFNLGEATWRIGQGTISSATLTDEELSNFIIEKYAAAGDTLGGYNVMLVERTTGNVGFGVTTNSPGASYVFKSISSGYYQGVFESLGNTSYLILRTSAGTGEDAGIRNVSGDISLYVPAQGDALTVNKTNRRVSIAQSLAQKRVAQTYSTSITLNTVYANWFTINVIDGNAFTMNAPVNVIDGQQITITFYNTSGVSMGAITWNGAFKLAAWTNPADGYNRSITFAYDGSYWIETSRTTSDIPN